MKKLLLFLFSICIFHFSGAQQYGWENISGNLPKFYRDTSIINGGADTLLAGISGITFLDDNHGWISTSHPFEGEPSSVLETIDGGQTWTVHSAPFSARDIHMIDAMNGYLGVENGFVYRTADGAQTWTLHGLLQVPLYDLGFPPRPAQTGYAGGKNGHLSKITPQGLTPYSLGLAGNVYCIDFPSEERGYALLDYQMIIFYLDGEWHVEASYPFSSKDWLYFHNDTLGWCVGEMFLKTTSGTDWYRTDPDFVQTGAMMGVHFIDENNGWAVGNPGQIAYSNDGGNDWTMLEHNLTDALLTGVLFTSPNNGYIIGGDKTILKYGVLSEVGIAEKPEVRIFPNPAGDNCKLQIANCKGEECGFIIWDVYGRNVMEFTSGVFPVEGIGIDVSMLRPGIYFVQVRTGSSSGIIRLIKQ